MDKIAKIKPIPKKGGMHQFTMQSSLRKEGLSRVPGTKVTITPYFDNNFKKYRTGLDEESKKVNNIPDDKERTAEKKRIKALRDKLENETGLDLTARSEYYKNVAAPKDNNTKVGFSLSDGENVFNLSIPEQHITFLWLSNHPDICPSLEHWEKGLCSPSVHWYVENIQEEVEQKVSRKREQNQAAVILEKLSDLKRRKIGIIISTLGITHKTSNEEIYTSLDDYIKANEVGLKHVKEFTTLSALSDDVLNAKWLAKSLMQEGIIRRFTGGVIREGEFSPALASSFEEFELMLSEPSNQEVMLVYTEKLKKHISLTYDII